MNKEQIDDFFNSLLKDDEEKMLEIIAEVVGVELNELKQSIRKPDEYIGIFAQKIESGDYKYFKSFETDVKCQEFILEILPFFSEDKNKDKIDLINRSKEMNLTPTYIRDLIESINDKEFTKKCILNGKEMGLKLDAYNIAGLIISIGEENFTKECIKDRDKLGLNLDDVRSLILQIKEDKEFLKKYVKNNGELKLDSKTIISLIKTIGEEKFTRECIEKREEFKLGLDANNIINLIEIIGKEKFTEECIEDRDKLGLNLDHVRRLIKLIKKDKEFLKECIKENKEKLRLYSNDIADLIKTIGEETFTIECIEDRDKLGLYTNNIIDLIETIKDDEKFIKKCILNKKELGLDSEYFIKKVTEMNDKAFSRELLEKWQELELDGETICELFKIAEPESSEKINFDKLEEILAMQDAEYLKKYLLDNIILNNIESENIDVNRINAEIEKTYEIFLTNDLPNNFKYFEFFKNHVNTYNSNNNEFYPDDDKAKRDKIIAGDLFRTLLESDNIKMRNFLENLYNGNLAVNEKDDSEIGKAILLKYRDILYELLYVVENTTLIKTEDYNKDLDKIREYLNVGEKDDLGEVILLKYLEGTGLDYKESGEPLIEVLLRHMDNKKQEAKKNNRETFLLEEGDIIKGTEIIYLEDFLKNGIRAKEFLMVGTIKSDRTPLDTDFSEITEENLQKISLEEILNSTYTNVDYGKTYLVIKKENYENDETTYTRGYGSEKTRYFRTGIGATKINAIITSEWQEEYKYMLARNGFYIPVINKEDGQVLFTEDDYKLIRESMQGLSHYGMNEFVIDSTAGNNSIKKEAEALRRIADTKVSTEEKREKVIEIIRKNIGKTLTTEMIGDVSKRFLEFIDTGSTRKRN